MTQSAAYVIPSKEEPSRVRAETRASRAVVTEAPPPLAPPPPDSTRRLEREVACRGWGILDAIGD